MPKFYHITVEPLGTDTSNSNLQSACNADNQESTCQSKHGGKLLIFGKCCYENPIWCWIDRVTHHVEVNHQWIKDVII